MAIRAVRVHRFTNPATLKLDRIDPPATRKGRVIVRVEAASVNPVDWKTAEGKYPPIGVDKLPIILGRDLAGIIASVEDGQSGWTEGDRVCAFLAQDGGAQTDYVSVPATDLVRIPSAVSTEAAGAIPAAAVTAWQGLFDHGKLEPGQRVLIHGGAGGVGHLAVQLARWRGCTVFATASARDVGAVSELGANRAIDYRAERFEDIANNLDLVFDTQGGETQARSFATLKPGGRLVSTLEPDEERAAQVGVQIAPRWHAEPDIHALGRVLDLVAEQVIRVEIARCFLLAEVAAAHRFAQTEHPRGKVLLTM